MKTSLGFVEKMDIYECIYYVRKTNMYASVFYVVYMDYVVFTFEQFYVE